MEAPQSMHLTSATSDTPPCKDRKELHRGFVRCGGAFVLLGLSGLSCSERNVTAIDVAIVHIEPSSLGLIVGDTARVHATLRDGAGNALGGRSIIWSSSAPEAVIVSSDGRILALAAGESIVAAESEGARGEVRVRVTAPPQIGLQPAGLAFDVVARGTAPAPITVDVRNEGDGILDALTVTIEYDTGQPASWLSATLAATSAPTTLTVTATQTGLVPGSYSATITILSPAARPDRRTIPITLVVRDPPPSIALTGVTALFIATEGGEDPAAQTLAITNAGGGSLTGLATAVIYAAGGPTGWLTASLSAPAPPSTLTLSAKTGSLPFGTYTATVHVSATGADNSPRNVQVTFDVRPLPPSLGLSPAALSFNAVAGGVDPSPGSVAITNTGRGTIDGLGLAISYPPNQPTGWLDAVPGATTAPASLAVQATTGTLPAGTYSASILVSSSAAVNSPQSIVVTFVVTPFVTAPQIGLSASTATFSGSAGGADPATQTIHVTNTSGGTLDGLTASVAYTSGPPGWLTASLSGMTAPATLTLSATIAALAAGTYTADVAVTSGAASNSPQTVSVTFTVAPAAIPPAIGLAPTSLSFLAVQNGNDPAIQDVSITNTGGGSLSGFTITGTYGANEPTGWLRGALTGNTAPTTLRLQPSTGSLDAGTYTATINVAVNGASNSPQAVTVTFAVVTSIFAPSPPSGLSASRQNQSVRLTWSDNSSNESFVLVHRATQLGGAWSTIAFLGADTTNYVDQQVSAGQTYWYRVLACTLLGCSVSNIASITM
jgi:hypothetical protein